MILLILHYFLFVGYVFMLLCMVTDIIMSPLNTSVNSLVVGMHQVRYIPILH